MVLCPTCKYPRGERGGGLRGGYGGIPMLHSQHRSSRKVGNVAPSTLFFLEYSLYTNDRSDPHVLSASSSSATGGKLQILLPFTWSTFRPPPYCLLKSPYDSQKSWAQMRTGRRRRRCYTSFYGLVAPVLNLNTPLLPISPPSCCSF